MGEKELAGARQGGAKVLIVDDDVALVRLLSFHLEKDGYTVLSAGDGDEGLRLASEERPDLILLDMNMPKLRGMGFYSRLRSPGGKTLFPIFVLTAQEESQHVFSDFPVEGFMKKPCDVSRLLSEVKRIVRAKEMEVRKAASALGSGRKARSYRGRILIVDDEPVSANALALAFWEAGYLVQMLAAGRYILNWAAGSLPDVVLVRLSLYDYPGYELIYKLHRMPETKNVQCILFTEENDLSLRYRFAKAAEEGVLEGGGLRQIVKSSEPAVLLKRAESLLEAARAVGKDANVGGTAA